jgi:hypothetical protein
VARTVQLRGLVQGEARVRQPLDASLGGPALKTLERALAEPDSGWRPVSGGYRFDVPGGYVIYLVEERVLEIVAVLEDEVQAAGTVASILAGELQTEVSADGEGRYYDDGWGGHNEAAARQAAEADAQRRLDEASRARREQAETKAEQQASAEIEEAARRQAQQNLQQAAAARQAELANAARQRLDAVGLQCRQAFQRVLARAYRDAILAYARAHNAECLVCSEKGGVIDIEFMVER